MCRLCIPCASALIEDTWPSASLSDDDFYCPSGYQLHGLHCYKLASSPSSYADAKAACAQDKGTLAVMHEDRTAQILASKLVDFYVTISENYSSTCA